ncbi:type I secretion system permease/ATPase [Enterobacter sp. A103]|uniref:type I secretion system permease/ATPase n=1 Tax=Enterobacter sp. A103 TaxID=3102785 RepID=UPI002ACA0CC1|nr:type I secretion system permease/ATPase [Enterobacter sp. A103]MDZ5641681.1 type I secretion system permease/ATPase [Enterobacter sp. A103]
MYINEDAIISTTCEDPVCCDGIMALSRAARHFKISIDPVQLLHRLGGVGDKICAWELCRCARWAGLRARCTTTAGSRLSLLPMPALVWLAPLGWCILEQADEREVAICSGKTGETHLCSLEEFVSQWDGGVILLAEKRDIVRQVKFGFSWFLPTMRRYIAQFRSILWVSLMLQMIALSAPILFENVTDRVLVSRSLSSLEVLGLGMLALAVFEPVWGFVRSWVFSRLAGKVNAELSGRLFEHLMALPMRYFQKRQTGEIIARVREMHHIRQFLTGSALTLVLDLAFVVVFLGVMFAYSAPLTSIVLGSLALYFLFWLLIGPLVRQRVTTQYELAASNTAFLTESVTGIETIKTTATERSFTHRWERQLADSVRATFRSKVAGLWAGQGIGLIQKLTSALLLWWGVELVMDGRFTPGELIAFNMFAGHVTQPILRLAQVWQDFQHTLISLRRVGDILDEQTESGLGGLASIPKPEGSVCFRGVRFRYNDDTPEVLCNLNVQINPGEFVGITGASGSGKSTLTRLLQRLYIPQHGQVLVDGMDLVIADPVSLRRNMSVVLQDSLLFSGSIEDNIRQCIPQCSREDVIWASKLAGAHEFIEALPEGYRTQVGEKGGQLSGGQRQRVALARALLTDPQILILDEATSALDYESEAAIMSNMEEICRGRTVISIAHRLNTLRGADRILVMDKGFIVEEGHHEELITLNGVYEKLWRLQTKS